MRALLSLVAVSEPVALPGGPVFIAQNMLSAADAEVAAILAHAIGHIELRHYTRQMTGLEVAGIRPSQMPPQISPRSNPRFELDADQFAVKLLLAAGYDPQALVQWVESQPIPKTALALGDRPIPSRRVAAIERAIQTAQ
jgi:predicted Zn-dependent protease